MKIMKVSHTVFRSCRLTSEKYLETPTVCCILLLFVSITPCHGCLILRRRGIYRLNRCTRNFSSRYSSIFDWTQQSNCARLTKQIQTEERFRVVILLVKIGFMLCSISLPYYALAAENRTEGGTVSIGNANAFIDEAITHWQDLLKESGYDPLFVKSFTQGRITCRSCRIEGLSTIQRTGDVTLNTSETHLIVDMNIGLARVAANCLCEASWAIFSVDGTISGTVTDFSVNGRLEQFSIGGHRVSPPQLTSLIITNEGQLSTFFNGNGLLGGLLEWFGQDFIRKQIKNVLTNASEMRNLLNRALVNVDLSKALAFS